LKFCIQVYCKCCVMRIECNPSFPWCSNWTLTRPIKFAILTYVADYAIPEVILHVCSNWYLFPVCVWDSLLCELLSNWWEETAEQKRWLYMYSTQELEAKWLQSTEYSENCVQQVCWPCDDEDSCEGGYVRHGYDYQQISTQC
jgi:hypothetical protein